MIGIGSGTIVWCVALTVTGIAAAQGQTVQPTEFEPTGVFQSEHLDEISGVAASRSQPGVYWSHNDSGDRARVYATNLEGTVLGVFRVRDADARDWEDIALGPCPDDIENGYCLYIADTGDNEGRRRGGTIYIVSEPEAPAEPDLNEARTERAHQLLVQYPDGPQDIEALAVTPEGTLLLVTKGTRGPIMLYSIPAGMLDETQVNARLVDTLPIRPARRFGNLATAAAVSPSGGLLVVRTYTELHFFGRQLDGAWRKRGQPCWIGLRQPQGEAVDFIDEKTLVLASESAMGRRGGLARAVCPIAPEPERSEQNPRLTTISGTPLAEKRSRR